MLSICCGYLCGLYVSHQTEGILFICHVLEFFFLHFLPFGNLLEILRIVLSLLGVFLNFPLQS